MRHPEFNIEIIIGYCDGVYSGNPQELIPSEFEGMTYDDLTQDEKELLEYRIDDCNHCGWTFDVENLNSVEDEGRLCWRCEETYYESKAEEGCDE